MTNPIDGPRSIRAITREILGLWGPKVHYTCEPYLREMLRVDGIDDPDPDGFHGGARHMVTSFLRKSTSFRGHDARRLKAELKALL